MKNLVLSLRLIYKLRKFSVAYISQKFTQKFGGSKVWGDGVLRHCVKPFCEVIKIETEFLTLKCI